MPRPKVPESVGELLQVIQTVRGILDETEAQITGRSPQDPLNPYQQQNGAALVSITVIPQDLWEC